MRPLSDDKRDRRSWAVLSVKNGIRLIVREVILHAGTAPNIAPTKNQSLARSVNNLRV